MRNLFVRVILFLVVFSHAAFAREVIDATGARIKITDHPKRIVTLAPSLGELVADLLGDHLDRIVGVSQYTDYPPALRKRTMIGPYFQFNLEAVLALKPDLVFATLDGNPKDQVIHLGELGVPVVTVSTGDFIEIGNSMMLVAEALGVSTQGVRMAKQLKTGLDRIKSKASRNKKSVRVMLQIGDQPLVVAGRRSFLHQSLETIGATNVYGDGSAHYPRPSVEDVIQRDPDFIVVVILGEDMSSFQEMARRWEKFPKMRAVRDHRIILLKADELVRPTLRILEGLSRLSQVIYGR